MIRKIFFSRIAVILFLSAITSSSFAQPFANEITAFKKADSASFPPQHAILFVGSSSFRKWTDVSDYFPGYTIINRGFGGSTLADLIRYEKDIIFPYQPKQVVIYCGENDIAYSDTITAETVFGRFKRLFTDIREKLPGVPITFVSIKPSPSRWKIRDRMIKANTFIKEYIKKQKHSRYVDVWDSMLDKEGKPIPDIFLQDNLHMNAKGYAIWKKLIEPKLIK